MLKSNMIEKEHLHLFLTCLHKNNVINLNYYEMLSVEFLKLLNQYNIHHFSVIYFNLAMA